MIATQLHRLATRLGVRDGEAYTIVCGVVVALLLAVVGLPGVFRGFDPTAIDQAAAATPSRPTSTPVADGPPPSTESVTTPSLPTLAPAPLPDLSASSSPPTSEPPPVTAPGAGEDTRPLGDVALLADVPPPGSPAAVAVAPDGTVYVVSDDAGPGGASALWAFSATGELLDTWSAPGQPVARARGLTGVAVAPDDSVWVVDASTARLLRLDRSEDALVPVADADDIPACGLLNLASPCEPGLVDTAPLLTGIASAPGGMVVVADRGQGVLWRVDGRDLVVLTTITDRVAGDGPVGLSFASDDELLVAVGARFTSFPPGLPAVFQIRLVDGKPEAPVVVADLELTETPADLVAGASGRVYVAIPSAGTIADIGIDQGDRIDIVGDGGASFTGPLGLALRDLSLLIADTTDRIFDLAVNDRPVAIR